MNDTRFQNRPRSFSGSGGNLPKQEVVSITYEEIGLFPRSFSRVLDRFLKQVFSDVENLVIQEYRFYRYLFLTTLKCVCLLFFVPFFINFLVKTYVVRPLAEYFWNTKQTEIFLNEYQQKHAFAELKDFEEKLYFESLIYPKSAFNRDQINIIREYNEKDELKESNIENNDGPSLRRGLMVGPFIPASLSNKDLNNLSVAESPRAGGPTKGSDGPGWALAPIRALYNEGPSKRGPLAPLGGSSLEGPSGPAISVYLIDKHDDNVRGGRPLPLGTPAPDTQAKMMNTENLRNKIPPKAGNGIIERHSDNMEIKNSETLIKSDLVNPLSPGRGTLSVGLCSPDMASKSEVNPRPAGQGSNSQLIGGPRRGRLLESGQQAQEYESLINSYTLKSSLFVYQTREADKNIQQRYQEQTILLAQRYNDQSIEAITHFFGDIVSLASLFYLFYALEIQINITKSFLLEVFFGLDDSKKSLLILLVTDLLVGYHSSNLWELFFSFIFHHYGLPESQTGIFLLVATLPVLLDVLFKYLIFRHLNRSSPATVATYHAMIE